MKKYLPIIFLLLLFPSGYAMYFQTAKNSHVKKQANFKNKQVNPSISLLSFNKNNKFKKPIKTDNKNTWYAFSAEDGKQAGLLGFKDKTGKVKIPPKFFNFTRTGRFDDVVAVVDTTKEKDKYYFLNKSGKVFGINQLYTYDMGTDCEHQGTIRFRNPHTDTVGIYDKNGKVIIPAEYSDISRLYNGLAVALKDATHVKDGEHSFWSGGESLLINRDNQILVKDFPYYYSDRKTLDYSTLQIENTPSKNSTRDSFQGVNGQYYTFVNNKKDFTQWLNGFINNDFSQEDLVNITYPYIRRFSEEKNGWYDTPSQEFIKANFSTLKQSLQVLTLPSTKYQIILEDASSLNFEIDDFADLQGYVNNCGEGLIHQYPLISVVVENKVNEQGQDHFDFLKTDNGYKLISVTLRSSMLK